MTIIISTQYYHLIVVSLLIYVCMTLVFASGSQILCHYHYDTNIQTESMFLGRDLMTEGQLLVEADTILCPVDTEYCFSLWLPPNDDTDNPLSENSTTQDTSYTSTVNIIMQGCWKYPSTDWCSLDTCSSSTPPSTVKILNSTSRFCCCSGDWCNSNVIDNYTAPDTTLSPAAVPALISNRTVERDRLIVISLILITLIISVTVVFFIFRRRLRYAHDKDTKCYTDRVQLTDNPPVNIQQVFNIETLKLTEIIGRGRFGTVWRSTLEGSDVATKLFQPQHKVYFENELEIHSIPNLQHDNLVKFVGGDFRQVYEGAYEYLLVMEYIELGNLLSYLRENIVNWAQLCRLCHSMSRGLAYLHSDVSNPDCYKPAIAHRDFNTRNILVRSNLTCAIGDLGFAMNVSGNNIFPVGQDETASLTDVGTPRYMPPEVLDGAVNLRDCESALKQIDCYALGLVLWEVATRCADLFPTLGGAAPEFRLPYEAELGTRPTIEDIQRHVSLNKQRPLFPDDWKINSQTVRSLKDTMEDLWDLDAEARLTAMCVEERMLDLSVHTDRQHSVTPTINPTTTTTTTTSTTTEQQQRNHTGPGLLHGLDVTAEGSDRIANVVDARYLNSEPTNSSAASDDLPSVSTRGGHVTSRRPLTTPERSLINARREQGQSYTPSSLSTLITEDGSPQLEGAKTYDIDWSQRPIRADVVHSLAQSLANMNSTPDGSAPALFSDSNLYRETDHDKCLRSPIQFQASKHQNINPNIHIELNNNPSVSEVSVPLPSPGTVSTSLSEYETNYNTGGGDLMGFEGDQNTADGGGDHHRTPSSGHHPPSHHHGGRVPIYRHENLSVLRGRIDEGSLIQNDTHPLPGGGGGGHPLTLGGSAGTRAKHHNLPKINQHDPSDVGHPDFMPPCHQGLGTNTPVRNVSVPGVSNRPLVLTPDLHGPLPPPSQLNVHERPNDSVSPSYSSSDIRDEPAYRISTL